jgi:hypothetical protein
VDRQTSGPYQLQKGVSGVQWSVDKIHTGVSELQVSMIQIRVS